MDGTREPLLAEESPSRGNVGGAGGAAWGSRLPGYPHYRRLPSASPTRYLEDDVMSAQDKMLMSQDDQLHLISNSVGSLKTVSKQIGIELDEQAVMLDDLNTELENADSKLDSTLKKVARVLHMNNGRLDF
ncbi:unnamed protein product [Danaus chrysippus]|uniref:(African queen) hypothetical protein n=1 Tax=Danaus chrysippus TaxID=151541 RepID=A0A8J2MFS4_9NEOP|nr:unnamed protein product [Danaus chrysippus]